VAKHNGVALIAVIAFLVPGVYFLYEVGLAALGKSANSSLLTLNFALSAGLFAVVAWGLFKLKNWARITSIAWLSIRYVDLLLRWIIDKRFTTEDLLWDAAISLLYIASVGYLFKREIKIAFLPAKQNLAVAPQN